MGASVALAARARGDEVRAWDTDPADAELAFVAAPIAQLPSAVAAALDAPGDATVTDVGSTKASVVEAAAGSPRFVGGHPICGAETRGAENASAGLFEGATWFLTPVAQTDPARHRRRRTRPARRTDEPRAARARQRRREPDRRDTHRRARATRARRRLAARHDARRRREPADLGRHLPRQRRADPR